jgi:short-subunit dehydrogenase
VDRRLEGKVAIVTGNIVAAGSEAGFNGVPQNSSYGGTKGWVHSFIKGVAAEQAKYGVRANCFCPGAIDTAWTHLIRKQNPWIPR